MARTEKSGTRPALVDSVKKLFHLQSKTWTINGVCALLTTRCYCSGFDHWIIQKIVIQKLKKIIYPRNDKACFLFYVLKYFFKVYFEAFEVLYFLLLKFETTEGTVGSVSEIAKCFPQIRIRIKIIRILNNSCTCPLSST